VEFVAFFYGTRNRSFRIYLFLTVRGRKSAGSVLFKFNFKKLSTALKWVVNKKGASFLKNSDLSMYFCLTMQKFQHYDHLEMFFTRPHKLTDVLAIRNNLL
jgi:hypothetical protein